MAGKLKPLDVSRQITPGKYPDGGGLYLIVAGPASRNWSYRYWIGGKERWHGLGSLKDVSLAEARLKRDAARLLVKGDRSTAGVDIVQAKRSARVEAQAEQLVATLPTFQQCAESYIDENWSKWIVCLSDDRPNHDPRDQTEPHLRIVGADLADEAGDREPRPRAHRNHHREERRHQRQGFPEPGRTDKTTAGEAAEAAQARRAPPPRPALCRGVTVYG